MNTASIRHVGSYLAVLQFFFTLMWTVYVIFLPKLAAQVGIPTSAVAMILMMDQLIFAVTDLAMGAMADRVAQVLGRLGGIVAVITGISCLAFLLLPLVAQSGDSTLFLLLVALWSATSSVLRAPPLALLGKYAAKPAIPWLASLSMFGLGLAGAVSPYLTVALREADPRLPFALSSVALLAVTLGLGWAERALAGSAPKEAPPQSDARREPLVVFLLAVALLGIGFQIHFALNAAPMFLKFAAPSELERLMPIFWIGFNLTILPGALATQRYGGMATMALGGVVGSLAAWAAFQAVDLMSLSVAQFVAGGAWGCVLMSAVAAALEIGRSDHGGRTVGALFSLLALAALARIAIVWTQLDKTAEFALLKPWLPAIAWLAAGALLLAVAFRANNGSMPRQ
ncbi:MAG TPA: MFS transporter [Rhodocyclaceae bacterium]|nr:MFS transporter [Rhodocyclaceae bacterium]